MVSKLNGGAKKVVLAKCCIILYLWKAQTRKECSWTVSTVKLKAKEEKLNIQSQVIGIHLTYLNIAMRRLTKMMMVRTAYTPVYAASRNWWKSGKHFAA